MRAASKQWPPAASDTFKSASSEDIRPLGTIASVMPTSKVANLASPHSPSELLRSQSGLVNPHPVTVNQPRQQQQQHGIIMSPQLRRAAVVNLQPSYPDARYPRALSRSFDDSLLQQQHQMRRSFEPPLPSCQSYSLSTSSPQVPASPKARGWSLGASVYCRFGNLIWASNFDFVGPRIFDLMRLFVFDRGSRVFVSDMQDGGALSLSGHWSQTLAPHTSPLKPLFRCRVTR
jgi:hypothetical protein